MRDPKASKRRLLATQEVDRMVDRYEYECKDLGTHKITEEEIHNFTKLISKKSYFNPLAN